MIINSIRWSSTVKIQHNCSYYVLRVFVQFGKHQPTFSFLYSESACCSTQLWGQWAPAKTSDGLEGGNYFFLTMILNVHGWLDFKAILSHSIQWTGTTHGRKYGAFPFFPCNLRQYFLYLFIYFFLSFSTFPIFEHLVLFSF